MDAFLDVYMLLPNLARGTPQEDLELLRTRGEMEKHEHVFHRDTAKAGRKSQQEIKFKPN